MKLQGIALRPKGRILVMVLESFDGGNLSLEKRLYVEHSYTPSL